MVQDRRVLNFGRFFSLKVCGSTYVQIVLHTCYLSLQRTTCVDVQPRDNHMRQSGLQTSSLVDQGHCDLENDTLRRRHVTGEGHNGDSVLPATGSDACTGELLGTGSDALTGELLGTHSDALSDK